jgi:hypothetical protein
MARIFQGPPGRTREGQAYQFHPSERMFLVAQGDPVAYEVDLLPGIEPRFRYQIIDTGAGLKGVAGSHDDEPRFSAAWKQFVAASEITIQKMPSSKGSLFRVATLDLSGTPEVKKVETRPKPASAWWDTFDSGMPGPAHARMSLDPFGRIRFRTERIRDIPKLLDAIFRTGAIPGDGGAHAPGSYTVCARSIYNINKVHRAVAKTLVNYAVDQLGAAFVMNPEFDAIRHYCIGGPDRSTEGPFVGVTNKLSHIPTIDGCVRDRHAVALVSDGSLVAGALKLYGHFLYRIHLGPAPIATPPFIRGVRIDFNGVGRIDPVSS